MFVQDQWYIAGMAEEVGREPLSRRICDERIVFYRKTNGEAVALPDRCPHRQVPLSKGCVVGDNIRCGYHGMEFSGDGKCVKIPSQAVIPDRSHLQHYPVQEKYGFVWIWIGKSEPGALPNLPELEVRTSDKHAGTMFYAYANTDYKLGVDNFLDTSHVTYVHPSTVASESVTAARTELLMSENEVRVRRVMKNEPCSPMFKAILKVDAIDRVQDSVFRPVGHTWIETTVTLPDAPDGPKMKTISFGLFTPETASTCHLWAGMYRDFAIESPQLNQIIPQQIKQTIDEDVRICEEVQANWDDTKPVTHFVADKGALAARQILRALGESRPETPTATKFKQLEATDSTR